MFIYDSNLRLFRDKCDSMKMKCKRGDTFISKGLVVACKTKCLWIYFWDMLVRYLMFVNVYIPLKSALVPREVWLDEMK
jgi:hypothetical protein